MDDLSNDDIRAMSKAVGLEIAESDLTPVAHSLNAILELMAEIKLAGVNAVEPLPITLLEAEV